jgi:glycosyltransferase involved in cell wall biosynthesis
VSAALKVCEISVRADVGGGPEHLFRLLGALGDRVEATVACPRQYPYWERFSALPNVTRMFELPFRKFSPFALLKLRRFARQAGIDLIHSHGKGAGIYGRVLACVTGIPCVHTYHGLHVGQYRWVSKRAYLFLERQLSRVSAMLICVSRGEAHQVLSARVGRSDKLAIIPNGVDAPAEVCGPRDDVRVLRVLTVSRFNTQKNAELALRILAIAERDKPGCTQLTILGDGAGRPEAERFAQSLGLASVATFEGAVDDIRAWLRSADAYLSTSRWEGMPLAVLEAMSEALPVAATDVPGNRDAVIEGRTGLLFLSDDASGGAAALDALRCGVTRARLGDAGRRRVLEAFSTKAMAEATYLIYQTVPIRNA